MTNLRERFLAKVNKTDGCWLWTAAKRHGYGAFMIGSKIDRSNTMAQAHRISYELFIGTVPDDLCVLHRCDNPPCVNPSHLFLGTKGDNNTDAARKGRSRGAEGITNGSARLTPELVKQARTMRQAGIPFSRIAREIGVSHSAAWYAVSGYRWKSVAP